jgi:hypothetical protein
MPIPLLDSSGFLPPGIHSSTLNEVCDRFGPESEARRKWAALLREIVSAATLYPTMKRVLVWGSLVGAKKDPADLDYSVMVSADHSQTEIADQHQAYFVPFEARRRFGVDRIQVF